MKSSGDTNNVKRFFHFFSKRSAMLSQRYIFEDGVTGRVTILEIETRLMQDIERPP